MVYLVLTLGTNLLGTGCSSFGGGNFAFDLMRFGALGLKTLLGAPPLLAIVICQQTLRETREKHSFLGRVGGSFNLSSGTF